MIIAGTGHRPDKLGITDDAGTFRLIEFARDQLRKLPAPRVISGMADGWDLALAIAAIAEGVPLTCAIPFEGHGVSGNWDVLYKLATDRAEKVITVTSGGYEPYKMQKRNRWMVDNSDALLALWNGTSGGTFNCLKYARERERLVLNTWPEWSAS